jgi:hypothetical protein
VSGPVQARPNRVIIWATHFQTDILALAVHLDTCTDVELLIVAADTAAFRREPIARALRLRSRLVDRNDPRTPRRVRTFKADVVVADNHVPPKGTAPRLFYMWHGLGWKARSRLDLATFYLQVRRLTGADPRRVNPRFMAQCYGPVDRDWRTGDWGLPRETCVETGMAFAALLRDPPYEPGALATMYRIDVARRKTVLLSITWHSGGIFVGHDDGRFVEDLLEAVRGRGADLLICLHDRHRYPAPLLAQLEALAASEPGCELRFKSDHPDNLSDLLVADVMVSNLSSFLVYFYVMGRPAIHIVPDRAAPIERVTMLFSRFRLRRRVRAEQAWMIDPADTGGPRASDAQTTIAATLSALDDPAPGAAEATRWLERHVPLLDVKAPVRIKRALDVLCSGGAVDFAPA